MVQKEPESSRRNQTKLLTNGRNDTYEQHSAGHVHVLLPNPSVPGGIEEKKMSDGRNEAEIQNVS